jgi:hypothetical protein
VFGRGLAGDEAVEAVGHGQAAQLAGRALPARLDGEETRHDLPHLEHRGGVVEHPEPGGAHAGSDRLEPLVAEWDVELVGGDHRVGGARQHGLDRVAGPDPAADAVDDLAQGHAQLDLAHAGAEDVADHGGHDDAGRPVGAE